MTTTQTRPLSETETKISQFVTDNYDVIHAIIHDDTVPQVDRLRKLLEIIPHVDDAGLLPYDHEADCLLAYPVGQHDPLMILVKKK